jgi:uncharacterized membrane protein YhdT
VNHLRTIATSPTLLVAISIALHTAFLYEHRPTRGYASYVGGLSIMVLGGWLLAAYGDDSLERGFGLCILYAMVGLGVLGAFAA